MVAAGKNSDDIRKELNDHAFQTLLELVEQFQLSTVKVLPQEDFKECWHCFLAFQGFDDREYAEKTYIDKQWVRGWRSAERRGNEVEGFLDTDALPSREMAVHYLWLAVILLEKKLKPRTQEYTSVEKACQALSARHSESARQDESLGESIAEVFCMPDGRPWDIKLKDDADFMQLPVRIHICLKNGVLGGGKFPDVKTSVVTFRELCIRTEKNLLQNPNFGRKSLNELKKFLEGKNLRLGMTFD